MKAEFAIDPDDLRGAADRLTRAYLRAGKDALIEVTEDLEDELEKMTRDAVGGRLWRAWKSAVSPPGKEIAKEPSGRVYVNGDGPRSRGAMAFFSSSGEIRSDKGKGWLVLPTPAAGPRGRLRDLTPTSWEEANGVKLRRVPLKDGRILLVADTGRVGPKSGRFRPSRRSRTAKDAMAGFVIGTQSAVIFVLVRRVGFRSRFTIEGPIARAHAKLASAVERRINLIDLVAGQKTSG